MSRSTAFGAGEIIGSATARVFAALSEFPWAGVGHPEQMAAARRVVSHPAARIALPCERGAFNGRRDAIRPPTPDMTGFSGATRGLHLTVAASDARPAQVRGSMLLGEPTTSMAGRR